VKTSARLECPFCKAKSNGVAPFSLGNANADDPPGWAAKNWESLTKPNFITRWRRVSLCLGSEKTQQQTKLLVTNPSTLFARKHQKKLIVCRNITAQVQTYKRTLAEPIFH